jgi:hypothetical protein
MNCGAQVNIWVGNTHLYPSGFLFVYRRLILTS